VFSKPPKSLEALMGACAPEAELTQPGAWSQSESSGQCFDRPRLRHLSSLCWAFTPHSLLQVPCLSFHWVGLRRAMSQG
jgi:hypothetical protein